MDAEYFLEDDQAQKITKENGRCSDSTDMAKNLVMEDLPGSANDEEDENVAGNCGSSKQSQNEIGMLPTLLRLECLQF